MIEKKIIISTDTSDATTNVNKLDTSIDNLNQSTQTYEKTGQSLKQELKGIVTQMAEMSLAGKEGTDAFKALAARGGELKDTLGDISTRLKNVGSDTKGLDQTVAAFTAMGNVAQVAEGSMALFGAESDAVARSIQKMVAIQSILNGVNEIANALQKESSFMLGVIAVKEKALAVSKVVITNLTRIFGITSAQAWAAATLGVSLLVTGIAIAITKYDTIIASVKEFFGLSKGYEGTNEKIKELNKTLVDYNENTQLTTDKLKAQGKTEQEILDFRKSRFKEQEKLTRQLNTALKKLGEDATDEEKKQIEETNDFLNKAWKVRYAFETEQIALRNKKVKEVKKEEVKIEKEADEEIIKNKDDTNKQQLEQFLDYLNKRTQVYSLLQNSYRNIQIQNDEDEIKQTKRLLDKIYGLDLYYHQKGIDEFFDYAGKKFDLENEYYREIQTLDKTYAQNIIDNQSQTYEKLYKEDKRSLEFKLDLIQSERAKILRIRSLTADEEKDYNDKMIAWRKENVKNEIDYTILKNQKLSELNNNYLNDRLYVTTVWGEDFLNLNRELNKIQQQDEEDNIKRSITAEDNKQKELQAVKDKYTAIDDQLVSQSNQQKFKEMKGYFDGVGDMYSAYSNLQSSFGAKELKEFKKNNEGKADYEKNYAKLKEKLEEEAFRRGRIIQSFSVIASTASAVMAAMAAPPVGLGPVAGLPLAIGAGIAGVTQLGAIWSAPGPSGSSGSGSIGSTPNASGMSSTPITATQNILTETEQQLQNKSRRVYVVESDIREVTNKVNVVQQESTF